MAYVMATVATTTAAMVAQGQNSISRAIPKTLNDVLDNIYINNQKCSM